MKNPRTTAEQIRPILQAMERSIESARRRRLHDTGTSTPEPRSTNHEARDTTDQPRQKARPKRGPSLAGHFDASGYRAPIG